MPECRVIVEFRDVQDPARNGPYMRWERAAESQSVEAFTLLGRAFEISRRECSGDFHAALAAFLRGAMIEKGDLLEVMSRLEDAGQPRPL